MERGTCPLCLQDDEMVVHMIWNCRAAGDMWADSITVTHKWPNTMRDFNQLWELLIRKMLPDDLEPLQLLS